MPYDQYPDSAICFAIDYRVRVAVERKPPAARVRRCSKSGIGFEQACNPLEFHQETTCDSGTGLGFVVPERAGEIALGGAVNRLRHRSSARSLASTSSIGDSVASPASISASRCAATVSHAASLALSASRLATTRSSNLTRSVAGNRRTSLSSASKDRDMMCTNDGWLVMYIACHNFAAAPPVQGGARRVVRRVAVSGADGNRSKTVSCLTFERMMLERMSSALASRYRRSSTNAE